MRYTTVIDVSEIPTVYRNPNAVRVYLHLVLKSGYHDADRDMISISIRRLATSLQMTVATVRHALHVLEQSGLIRRVGPSWVVYKWIPEQPISPRQKKGQPQRDDSSLAYERQLQQEARERRYEEQRRNAISYEEYLKTKQQAT